MRLRGVRLVVAIATALSAQTLTAPPAQAQPCETDLVTWQPQLNSNDQPFFKAQMIATCQMLSVTVIVCAAFWDGSSREQLGTCVSGTKTNTYQITRNKTLVGGCAPNLGYVTKARGYFTAPNGVTYTLPAEAPSSLRRHRVDAACASVTSSSLLLRGAPSMHPVTRHSVFPVMLSLASVFAPRSSMRRTTSSPAASKATGSPGKRASHAARSSAIGSRPKRSRGSASRRRTRSSTPR